jgi:hypothetical protein
MDTTKIKYLQLLGYMKDVFLKFGVEVDVGESIEIAPLV